MSLALIITSCSVPNLESPQCTAARNSVKRFYSLHFANDNGRTEDYLRARKEFLTDGLAENLSSNKQKNDYFTQTEDFPKAFRVGGCTAESDEKAGLQVVLLWRDDTRNDQSEVVVRTVKSGDKWLIDSVGK
jgi:hypothetical protein